MALRPDQIADLVKTTLDKYERQNYVDISLDYPEYHFSSVIQNKNRLTWNGGISYKWDVQVANDDNAKFSGMYDEDTLTTTNLMQQASVNAVKVTTGFMYDVDEEAFQGDNLTKIVDYIGVKKHSMENDFFTLCEAALWSAPASSSVTPMPFFGIPFWLQKSTTAAFGFNGTDPSGFTAGAGNIASATYPNWANGTATYSQINEQDFLVKLKEACVKTNFMAPASFAELGKPGGSNWGHYTTYRVIGQLEKLLRSNNDNLGTDLSKYMGATMFAGNPIKYVPYLETNDSTDPVYSVNWNTMKVVFVNGKYRQRSPAMAVSGKHSVRAQFEDTWMQLACHNRRANHVLRLAP